MENPELVVIAGPNGSGKTTFTRQLLESLGASVSRFTYVNPDDIAARDYPDLPPLESNLQAAQSAERIREAALAAGQDLMFETVLSTKSKVEFIERAKRSGYFTRLIFISTSDATTNASRVAVRVDQGGHPVDINKILARHVKSVANCAALIPLVDRAYVFDNSVDDAIPRRIFRTVDGKVAKIYVRDRPAWCEALMSNLPSLS